MAVKRKQRYAPRSYPVSNPSQWSSQDEMLSDAEAWIAAEEERAVEAARIDVNAFATFVFRDEAGEPIQQGVHHREWHAFLDANDRAVVFAPMESGKSRQLCIIRPLFELGRDPNLRVSIISESFAQAQKWLLAIREHVEHNERLRRVFPHLTAGKPWLDSHLNVAGRDFGQADFSLTALGQQGRFLGARVDLLICDDLCSLSNTLTQAARDKLDDWFQTTALSRVTREGRVWMIGTAWDDDDVLHRCSSRDTSNPETTRRHWPTLVHKIRRPDGSPLWREQWDEARILRRQTEMTPSAFARGYENEARSDSSSRFKRKWVEDALLRGSHGIVLDKRSARFPSSESPHFLVGMDLGGGRKRGDLCAMVAVAAFKSDKGQRCRAVLSVESGHWQTPEAVSRMAEHNARYQPLFWVENVATQELFVQAARWLTAANVRGHTTGKAEASLQFEAEHLAVEFEQGLWSLPSVDGKPATVEVAALVNEILDYHPDKHVGDRLAALLFARAHADEGFGSLVDITGRLWGRS